jgi:hypothetical protein
VQESRTSIRRAALKGTQDHGSWPMAQRGSGFAARGGMADVIRWVLSQENRQLSCVTRLLDGGSALAVVYFDGLPVNTHLSASDAEDRLWTDSIRVTWMAHGWQPADPPAL